MTFGYYETPLERAIREAIEREARRKSLLGNLLSSSNPFTQGLGQNILGITKRKVFISRYHGDENEVQEFVEKWKSIFTPRMIGVSDEDDFIDSDDPAYVMSQIRKKYLQDTSVTIVLMGSCTHSRRYVDWEIKASLRQTLGSFPSGLIGILLPSQGNSAYLPPRFQENWNSQNKDCYARYYAAPTTAIQLRNWIEDAFSARTLRAKYIKNSSDMMKYNGVCKLCGETH